MLGSSRESWTFRGSLSPERTGEQIGLALTAVVLALAIAAWVYGVYCYVQMVRHRRPGVPILSMMWPAQFLTERGREFRRRALLSYGVFAILGLLLILWGWLQRS
jgi:hypothetical protein